MILVYDDTRLMPKDIRDVVRQRRFGDLMDGGEQLRARLRAAADMAGMKFLNLYTKDDIEELTHEVREGLLTDTLLHWPSRLAPPSARDAATLLQRAAHLDAGTRLRPRNAGVSISVLASNGWAELVQDLLEPSTPPATALDIDDPIFDLSDGNACFQFLSGAFRTRHFNDIVRQGHTLTKKSQDRAKMRAEHDYYYLIPHAFQRFFVQPYNFHDTEAGASYEMERLMIPDMSVLWTHHAFSPQEFGAFLDRAFDFLERRPRFPRSRGQVQQAHQDAHATKLVKRRQAFQAWPDYARFNAVLHAAVEGGYEALCERWADLRSRIPMPAYDYLVAGHGDFCMSNILYDKRAGVFKVIDPKGAVSEDGLPMDPGYDLAKLSHSVLGGYDFVVKDIARTEIRADLTPVVRRMDLQLHLQQQDFLDRLAQKGIDWRAVRLDEACLFLSMLPLHIDAPGRVLALALTARDILDAVERGVALPEEGPTR